MQESYWGYWLILLGVFVTVVMMLIQSITTSNTQDYYQLKEITESSMVDSVDYAYYRLYGEVKINKEKFVENFLRRFAETVSITTTYQIDFYDLYEAPPKVSVKVTSLSNTFSVVGDETSFDIVNKLDAILETNVYGSGDECSYYDETDGGSVSVTPSTPVTSNTCSTGMVTASELSGVRGVVMKDTVFYETLDKSTSHGNLNADGTVFRINGTDSTGKMWNIDVDGTCGWISNEHAAVNLDEFIPGMEFNITNKVSSIYHSKEETITIPNVTGYKLYTDDYLPIARYSFAVKLKKAQEIAERKGYAIIVYDAYRPRQVSTHVYNKFKALYDTNDFPKQNVNANGWHIGWFIATSVSKHNYACAVDVSLINKNTGIEISMPSKMHDLSIDAVKYSTPDSGHFTTAMENSQAARDLHNIMTSNEVGLKELKSEWWHYEDYCSTGTPIGNFWSMV